MKKSFFLFLFSLCFALPAFAAQNTAQTSQTVKTAETPAQVNVTINNTTTAQGNTQTTTVEHASARPATITAAASTTNPDAGQNVPTNSLFGNYASSPYQSNIQVEMLRNTVWGSLVPRKRLYSDPAQGKSSGGYSKYAGKQSSKKKSANKQAAGKQSGSAKNGSTQLAGMQNPAANGGSEQALLVVQKDGLLCVPAEQLEQIIGQKFVLDTAGSNSSVFYVPASPSPSADIHSGAAASPVSQGVTTGTGSPAGSAGSIGSAGAVGTNPAIPANAVSPAGSGANPGNRSIPANTGISGNPANQRAVPASPASPYTRGNSVNPASGAGSANAANPVGSASPAGSAQSAAPANSSVNPLTPEKDIFAIPANPFEPVTSSAPSPSGGTRNPLDQNSLGQNPMAQNPSVPPVSAGGSQNSGRDIGITPGNSGAPNS